MVARHALYLDRSDGIPEGHGVGQTMHWQDLGRIWDVLICTLGDGE